MSLRLKIMSLRMKRGIILCVSMLFLSSVSMAQSDTGFDQENTQVVVLSALDKITTQLSTIEIRQGQMVRFGTLEMTLRFCRSNPPEDAPESAAFLEITDVGHNNISKKVFSGWMFASSPALSPLEHPVYDVWVKTCKVVSGPTSSSKE